MYFCYVVWTSRWVVLRRLLAFGFITIYSHVIKTIYMYVKNPYTCVQPVPSTYRMEIYGRTSIERSLDGRMIGGLVMVRRRESVDIGKNFKLVLKALDNVCFKRFKITVQIHYKIKECKLFR